MASVPGCPAVAPCVSVVVAATRRSPGAALLDEQGLTVRYSEKFKAKMVRRMLPEGGLGRGAVNRLESGGYWLHSLLGFDGRKRRGAMSRSVLKLS